jgi:hypothetical protein
MIKGSCYNLIKKCQPQSHQGTKIHKFNLVNPGILCAFVAIYFETVKRYNLSRLKFNNKTFILRSPKTEN